MNNNKGFTLIEAIVSLAIFIVIASTLAEIVITSIQNQIKVTAMQNMFNQGVFSLDKIEKELRMAKKDSFGLCIGAEKNYAATETSITFLYNDQEATGPVCKKFSLEGNRIVEYVSSDSTMAHLPTTGMSITSSSISINNLKFVVSNDSPGDTFQPKVTISLSLTSAALEDQAPLQLQTTISQRRLDL